MRTVRGRRGGRRLFSGHGEAEVRDPDATPAVQHDVGGLQVAVQDPFLVRGGEARAELPGDLEGLGAGQVPDPLQERGQVLPSTYSMERKCWPSISSTS